MSIESRLRALERKASSAGFTAEDCPACGRPEPRGREVLVVDAAKGEKPRECSRCGRFLDESGRPLGPNGQVILVDGDDESLERAVEGPDGQLVVEGPDGQLVAEET